MSDLEDLRRRMREFAAARRAAQGELHAANADLRHAPPSGVTRGAGRERASARVAAARAARTGLRFELDAHADLLDPMRSVGALFARTPIALLPMRMETRFFPAGVRGPAPRLLVRLYPDDCLVESFHPDLSASEKKSVRRFWVEYWAAAGEETQRRAAWAALVRGHGGGRAAWAIQRVRPNSPEPARTNADDVFLVAPAPPPPANERAAIALYWENVLRAGRASAAEATAFGALSGAIGAQRANEVKTTLEPGNINVRRPPGTARVELVYLEFDEAGDTPFWSRAARAEMLPDRFVLLGRTRGGPLQRLATGAPIQAPLECGPDPEAAESDWLDASGDRVAAPDPIAWMFDFERAVSVGLGFDLDLTAFGAETGFDELIALGLRLDPDPNAGVADLEELLRRHRYSSGLALVPQGAPTNNTEGESAARFDPDDPEATYNLAFAAGAAPTWDYGVSDAVALADGLGLARTQFEGLVGATSFDIAEARAMNTAVWPATLGHFLRAMMAPLIPDHVTANMRLFFRDHVSGRGGLPVIRIKRQPYGILPSTAFSRLRFPSARGQEDVFLTGLHAILERMAEDWRQLAKQVATVMRSGDTQQNLLDTLALHPASVEHYVRLAQSWDQLRNTARMRGLLSQLVHALFEIMQRSGANQLLTRLGHTGTARPAILERLFLEDSPERPRTPVIEKAPLSETRLLGPVTEDDKNYIAWLAENALVSPDIIRTESGFAEGKKSNALLYLYLRHALMTGFADESDDKLVSAGALDLEAARARQLDQSFIHVAAATGGSESRFASIYATDIRVTGDASVTVGDHIAGALRRGELATPLADLGAALDALKDLPTARLERLFCEHLDCCAYRLDAWRLGLVRERLSHVRTAPAAIDQPTEGAPAAQRAGGGLYLGAYAYLENVRPKRSQRTRINVPSHLRKTFGDRPIEGDAANKGYVLAPGLNHAVTAAVLRAGYDGGEDLSVKLSSERVRVALFLQDGMRQGQSLGALLGYLFERGVHDAPGTGAAEGFLQELRRQFPLVADRMKDTQETAPGVPIEALQARNVVDGLRFVEHARKTSLQYPYGLPLTNAPATVRKVLDAQLQVIIDAEDAFADLALAESVHQALMSNMERAAGTLGAVSEARLPGETPDVVRSPRSGRTLTMRLAINLESGVAPNANAPPRAILDPALERFIARQFPPMADLAAVVFSQAPGAAAETQHAVTAGDLGLAALDLVHLMGEGKPSPMLDLLIVSHVRRTLAPHASLRVAYLAPTAKLRFFETATLAAHWRKALASRPLAPGDLCLPKQGAAQAQAATARIDPDRVAFARAHFDQLRASLANEVAALEPLLDGSPASQDALVAAIDAALDRCEQLFLGTAKLGLSGSDVEWIWTWRAVRWRETLSALEATRALWRDKLAACDAALADFDTAPADATEAARFLLLQAAENAVSASLTLTPGALPAYRAALDTQRTAFAQRLAALDAFAAPASFKLVDLVAGLEAAPPLAAFDRGEPVNTKALRAAIETAAADLHAQCVRLAGELQRRIDAVDGALAGIAASELPLSVTALQEAGQHLIGEAHLAPELSLPEDQASELALAFAHGATTGPGSLLAHARTQSPDPVEDWLHGLARVRGKARALEQAMLLSETLTGAATSLSPAQLPHAAGASWLGAAPPADETLAQESLVYTALCAAPFDATKPVCGLLLDEWVELIPAREETVGLSFHFDRPNSEAPQSWLLAVSPQFDGGWRWDDLVDTVRETMDMARSRAVDPILLDDTAYAQFLPATILTMTRWPITISTVLATLDLPAVADA